MSNAISRPEAAGSVEYRADQVFLIAVAASNRRRDHAQNPPSFLAGEPRGEVLSGLTRNLRITNAAALSNIPRATSNCGFASTTANTFGEQIANAGGRASFCEMKLRSLTSTRYDRRSDRQKAIAHWFAPTSERAGRWPSPSTSDRVRRRSREPGSRRIQVATG